MEPAPRLRPDPPPEGEGHVDKEHYLERDHPERGPQGPIRDKARDDEVDGRDAHRLVEDERDAVEHDRAEGEEREKAVEIRDGRGPQSPPERS